MLIRFFTSRRQTVHVYDDEVHEYQVLFRTTKEQGGHCGVRLFCSVKVANVRT